MKRKFHFSDETRQAAHKLLAADEEMLHEWPPVAPSTFCVHCKAFRGSASSDEECSVLLRCALQMLTRPIVSVSESPADNADRQA